MNNESKKITKVMNKDKALISTIYVLEQLREIHLTSSGYGAPMMIGRVISFF
mgnify:CR=1 FL=1|jgi:hypothetical protein